MEVTTKIKKLASMATDGKLKIFLQETLDKLKEGHEAIAERQNTSALWINPSTTDRQ